MFYLISKWTCSVLCFKDIKSVLWLLYKTLILRYTSVKKACYQQHDRQILPATI